MRLFKLSLYVAIAAMFASTASAVTVNMTIVEAGTTGVITGNTVDFTATGGGTLELDIAISNTTGAGVTGIGTSVVARQDGTAVDFGELANLADSSTKGQYLFSFSNFVGLAANEAFVSEAADIGVDVLRAIQSVVANPENPAIGDGSSDGNLPGVGGGNGGQVRLVLDILATGSLSLEIVAGDGITTNPPGAATSISGLVNVIVPEPGTALLMGLGLAGLAAAGRRK